MRILKLNNYFYFTTKTSEILKSLPTRWDAYKLTLVEAEEMLKKYKVHIFFYQQIFYQILNSILKQLKGPIQGQIASTIGRV
jgi:hypothetical protein